MGCYTEIVPDIYRCVIPFEDIYTTVFLIKTPAGAALFDTATYADDMDKYIFPAMAALDITPETLKYVFVSHNHRDHAGGLGRLLQKFPHTELVACSSSLIEQYSPCSGHIPGEGEVFMDCLKVICLPGHTPDCMGVMDIRTKTLLSGDCLQLYGIYGSGSWGSNVRFPVAYLAAVDKLGNMDIQTIVAAHNYHPGDYIARGAAEIVRYLQECVAPLQRIRVAICRNPHQDDETIAGQYTKENSIPTVSPGVVAAIRQAMEAGKLDI